MMYRKQELPSVGQSYGCRRKKINLFWGAARYWNDRNEDTVLDKKHECHLIRKNCNFQ